MVRLINLKKEECKIYGSSVLSKYRSSFIAHRMAVDSGPIVRAKARSSVPEIKDADETTKRIYLNKKKKYYELSHPVHARTFRHSTFASPH